MTDRQLIIDGSSLNTKVYIDFKISLTHSASMNSLKAMKRADSPAQKKDRRKMILKAAAEELDNLRSLNDFTIDSLAKRLGLARGTIYLYFKDRDAIFRVLLVDVTNEFLTEVAESFSTFSAPAATPRKIAHVFCEVLRDNHRHRHLPQLLKSLSTLPEKKTQNLEADIESCREQADVAIVRHLSGLKPGDGRQIIHYGWMLLMGFSEIFYNPSKTTLSEDVLQRVEDGLTLIIEGLLSRSK